MSKTIQAPTTCGGTVELAGDVVGSFLIHRTSHVTLIGDDVRYLWSVTHMATGMRFPWQFNYKKTARGFAKDVESLMEWSAVKTATVAAGNYSLKGKWVAGAPTPEQTAAIHKAAEAHGALKS